MNLPEERRQEAGQTTKHRRTIVTVILVALFGFALIVGLARLDWRYGWTEFGAYRHPTNGEVLWGRTLWDWLDLLIVPIVLAVGGLLFSQAERRTERRLAEERAREIRLQGYLDKMTDLLLHNDLRKSAPDAEIRDIARARTLTVLRSLDPERKTTLLWFLLDHP